MESELSTKKYFQESSGSDSNFFDNIPSSSVILEENNTNKVSSESTASSQNVDSAQTAKPKIKKSGTADKMCGEPELCKIFSSVPSDLNKKYATHARSKPGNNFFDMLYSIDDDKFKFPGGDIGIQELIADCEKLWGGDSDICGLQIDTSGVRRESERRREAWIPSERTRQALIAAATSPFSGTYSSDRDLITMPGVSPEAELNDPVAQLVRQTLGPKDSAHRKVLTADDVTQDERGVKELIEKDNYRAAANLTARLLTRYGQGVGRAGIPSKHTVHSIQLWFTRLTLLVKLKELTIADIEAAPWWDFDRPDLYYQFYPDLYGGRLGTMVPFQMRLLLAFLPGLCGRYSQAMDRLYSIISVVKKIRKNLESGCSEDGSPLEISAADREESKQLWECRESRALISVVNVALWMKDYRLMIDILKSMVKSHRSIAAKRVLYSTLGRVALQLGDLRAGDKYFMLARACRKFLIPRHNTSDSFVDLVDQGLTLMAKNRFMDGYASFEKASNIDPSVLILNNSAVCLLYSGYLKEAIYLLKGAVRNHPRIALSECLVLNLCTLYELESSRQHEKKLKLLKKINKHKGDSFNISCLKLN